MNTELQLTEVFSMLSMLAVGGGSAVLPEMQTLLERYFGFTQTEFVHAYSIGQLAPGPMMLTVLIMGEIIDGLKGGIIAGLAFFVPSSILCFSVGRLWRYIGERPWRRSLQMALEPLSIGLMCSAAYIIAKESIFNWQTAVVAVIVATLMLRTTINPVLLILGAAAIGFLGQIHG